MNICAKCRHYLPPEDELPAARSYAFGAQCGHPGVQYPPMTNPVTGDCGYNCSSTTAYRIWSSIEHPMAMDINKDGECERWEAKP